MFGPCLSSNVAVRPLRPATRLRLGGPLHLQLADRPQAPPIARVIAFGSNRMLHQSSSGITSTFAELSQSIG